MKKEKPTTKIAVWMDHTEAQLIEPGMTTDQIRLILSPFKGKVRKAGEESDGIQLGNYRSTNNESHKHFREQNELLSYYKQLAEALMPYNEILISGPSTAHNEVYNYLLNEKKFSGKKISVKKTDYITPNQIREIAENFFDSDVKIFNKKIKF